MNLPLRDPIPENLVVQELLERILFRGRRSQGESRNLRVGYGSDMVFEDVEGFRRWWLLWWCRVRIAFRAQEYPSRDSSAAPQDRSAPSGPIYYRQNASTEITS
jgi:hypothetical protein